MTHPRLAALVLVAALVDVTAAFCGPNASAGGGAESHVINDPQLGLAAFSVRAPRGWTVRGRTSHDAGCAVPADYLEWTAQSPDGLESVSFSSGMKYGATTLPQQQQDMRAKGCVMFPSKSAADVLQRGYLPQRFPGARILSISPIPAADPRLQTLERGMRQAQAQVLRRADMQLQMTVNGASARVAFQRNGKAFEAQIDGFAQCGDTRMRMPGGPGLETLDCTLTPATIEAPAGRLDRLAADYATLVTAQNNPAYDQRIAQIRAQQNQQAMQRITANGQAENQRIIAQGQAGMARLRAQGDAATTAFNQRSAMYAQHNANVRARSDTIHESNQAFGRVMGDQAKFQRPDGQTFLDSNQYSHTYVGPNGQVLQTNSAYSPGPDWTETQGR